MATPSRSSRRLIKSRAWYKFSRSRSSVAGLVIVAAVILLALFSPYVTPYPKHAGVFTDFERAGQPPSFAHLMGTDTIGRDILTRVIFGYRVSLLIGLMVLAIVVPI